MQKRLLILVALMVSFITTMTAQITTSGLSGKVMADGETVIGATIEAVHTPSGTKYQAVTNSKGMFTINGMRPGGPYTVKVSYVGYQAKEFTDVKLELAQTYNLPVVLNEATNELKEVTVVSKATKFTTEQTGASTNIDNSMIASMPTVNRSVSELTRLSPYGGNGLTFAGSDGRTANFTVDGANFNNDFGLSSNLPGGGNPISMDAIQEVQVVISPFDVRQTNFIGGGLNAITKSGTNTFKGTAYIYHQNENMRGDAIDGTTIATARAKDRSTTYGMTLGGPILKDKLFFFVNAEVVKTPTEAVTWRASEDGVGNSDAGLSYASVADMERVKEHVMTKYGYNPGSYTSFPADKNNTKLLARIDWNINNMHKLAFRYNYTNNENWTAPNASSMDGGVRSPYSRTSLYSMSFSNSMYSMNNKVHSFSLDLNSRLTSNLSNQFLATFAKKDDVRGTDSSEFPFIDIQDGTGQNVQYMSLGYELFTWNNAVHNTTWNIKDDLTYYYGNHKIMGGFNFEHQMADNQYMRNGTGYYRYRSVDDFINGAAPEVVCLTYGYNGDMNPTARVQYSKVGVYGQDEWQATDNFKLTYGLRIDNIFFNNGDLMTNNAIKELSYNGRHIDTGKWPSSSLTFSPRVGFTWDVMKDRSLIVRGGTGLFSGRLPLVFFTNMPTNSGMVQYQMQLGPTTNFNRLPAAVQAYAAQNGYTSVNDILTGAFSGGLVTDENGRASIAALYNKLGAMGYPTTITPEEGTVPSSISAVDHDFKMPQVWKSSIAVDYSLPVGFPMTVTAEAIFNKTLNAATISDWSMRDPESFARWNGADNRPIYPTGFRTSTKAFVLENTSRGYGWSTMFQVKAEPTKWLSLTAAYTHQVNKEVTSLPGSNAESAFTYVPTVFGPNRIKLHNSINTTPDRFFLSATAHDRSGNHYSLIYETWRGGYNYSYMLANDMNGDGYSYDALYIPTDKQVANNEFRFTSLDDQKRFMDYVHANGYLKDHQGEYAEAYSVYNPWVHRVDISYKHDFTVNVAKTKHTLQLSFDVKNLLNLFNDSWGVSKYMNPALNEGRILKYDHTDADGYPVFSTPKAVNGNVKTFVYNPVVGQCWYASIGVKYMFN